MTVGPLLRSSVNIPAQPCSRSALPLQEEGCPSSCMLSSRQAACCARLQSRWPAHHWFILSLVVGMPKGLSSLFGVGVPSKRTLSSAAMTDAPLPPSAQDRKAASSAHARASDSSAALLARSSTTL